MSKASIQTLTTPVVTAAYAHLAQPDEGQQYSDGKYKVTCLVKKDGGHDDFVKSFEEKCEEAAVTEWNEVPKNLQTPLRDGDENQKEDFHGSWLITGKTKFRPPYFDCAKPPSPLIEGQEPKSGDLVRAKLKLQPYTMGRNKGIAVQLLAVQLVEKRNMSSVANIEFDEIDGYVADASDSEDDGDF